MAFLERRARSYTSSSAPGFDQGPEDCIDGLWCGENSGNVRIENHGATATLDLSDETVGRAFL